MMAMTHFHFYLQIQRLESNTWAMVKAVEKSFSSDHNRNILNE